MAVRLSATEHERVLAVCAAFRDWAPAETQAPQISEVLSGGTSNRCVVLAGQTQRWLLRIANTQAREGVGRHRELRVHRLAADAGLAPAIHWADPARGWLLMDYLPPEVVPPEVIVPQACASLTPADFLQELAALLRGIHALPAAGEALNLRATLQHYGHGGQSLAAATAKILNAPAQDCTAAVEKALNIVDARGDCEPMMCHNDLLAANRLRSQGQLVAIDWEYAAPGDPFFDLSGCASELSDEQGQQLFRSYLLRKPTSEESRAFDAFSLIYAYLSGAWYLRHAPRNPAWQDLRINKELVRKINALSL